MKTVFILLVIFQLKHLLADYFFQTPWMLNKFLPSWGFVKPLAAHAAVHCFGSALIVMGLTGSFSLSVKLGLLDGTVHFFMDRIKAGPRWLGRFKPVTADEFREYSFMKQHPGGFLDEHVVSARRALRSNRWFWHSIGIDQAIHHLCHYLVIWLALR